MDYLEIVKTCNEKGLMGGTQSILTSLQYVMLDNFGYETTDKAARFINSVLVEAQNKISAGLNPQSYAASEAERLRAQAAALEEQARRES